MPDLIGMERGDAHEALGKVGVEDWVERLQGEDSEDGVVIFQDPDPGTQITDNTEVKITIDSRTQGN